MRITKSLILLAAVAALAPAPARAQILGKFQWAGVGNSFGWSYKRADNTYLSVYGGAGYQARFQINVGEDWRPLHGTTSFGPVEDIYCVDFKHDAKSSYNAWFTKLDGSDDLTKTRSGDKDMYLKAAWLIQKMDATPLANQDERADIHAAIWYLMASDPIAVRHWNGTAYVYNNTGMNHWLDRVRDEWQDGSVEAYRWSVVTDECVANVGHAGVGFQQADNCSQEFLTRNVTPEPATLMLLGTGLLATLGMTGVLRRRTA